MMKFITKLMLVLLTVASFSNMQAGQTMCSRRAAAASLVATLGCSLGWLAYRAGSRKSASQGEIESAYGHKKYFNDIATSEQARTKLAVRRALDRRSARVYGWLACLAGLSTVFFTLDGRDSHDPSCYCTTTR